MATSFNCASVDLRIGMRPSSHQRESRGLHWNLPVRRKPLPGPPSFLPLQRGRHRDLSTQWQVQRQNGLGPRASKPTWNCPASEGCGLAKLIRSLLFQPWRGYSVNYGKSTLKWYIVQKNKMAETYSMYYPKHWNFEQDAVVLWLVTRRL